MQNSEQRKANRSSSLEDSRKIPTPTNIAPMFGVQSSSDEMAKRYDSKEDEVVDIETAFNVAMSNIVGFKTVAKKQTKASQPQVVKPQKMSSTPSPYNIAMSSMSPKKAKVSTASLVQYPTANLAARVETDPRVVLKEAE